MNLLASRKDFSDCSSSFMSPNNMICSIIQLSNFLADFKILLLYCLNLPISIIVALCNTFPSFTLMMGDIPVLPLSTVNRNSDNENSSHRLIDISPRGRG